MLEALEVSGGIFAAALYGLAAGITWGRVGTWMERVNWHTLRRHSDIAWGRLNRCQRCAHIPLVCALLWPLMAPACEGIQFATKRRYSERERLDMHIAELEAELGMDDD